MAQELFDSGDVQQENADTFTCQGSNGRSYEITRVNDPQYNYKFYCKCPAWKFDTTRECKHVLAVQLFEKNTSTQPSHTHTATNSKPKATLRSKKSKNKKGYTVKKDGNKNTMDWTEPDGSKTKFEFDSEGNLIGKVKA